MITKEILAEEIKKTKETLKTLEKLKKDNKTSYDKMIVDIGIGLEMNTFVLSKLEEEYNA